MAGTLQAVTDYKASLHCTGPIHVWVRIVEDFNPPIALGSFSGIIYYVGTCEQHPVTYLNDSYQPIYTSTGGKAVPYDKAYLGSEETIVLDLNRFNHTVIDMLESAPQYGRNLLSLQGRQAAPQPTIANGGVFGMTKRIDRGSLLIGNKAFFQVWLKYSYFGTVNAEAFPDMPPGWFYFCCNTATCYTPKQGAKTMLKRLVIEAVNLHDDNDQIWGLKTDNAAAFALIDNLQPE